MLQNEYLKYLKYKKKYLNLKQQAGMSAPSGPVKVKLIHGKSQDIAMNYESGKVGILIASNPGRPGGALGKIDGTGLDDNYNKN